MPGLDPVLLAVYSEVEGGDLVEVPFTLLLPLGSFQALNPPFPGLAEGRSQSQSPCCPWLALQRPLCSTGAQCKYRINNGWQDEPDNGRRRSTTWYVEEYKEKEEEEEEEDGGGGGYGGGRDLSWDQSEVCNLFRWFSMM